MYDSSPQMRGSRRGTSLVEVPSAVNVSVLLQTSGPSLHRPMTQDSEQEIIGSLDSLFSRLDP